MEVYPRGRDRLPSSVDWPVSRCRAEDAKPETLEHLRPVFELAACAALPR